MTAKEREDPGYFRQAEPHVQDGKIPLCRDCGRLPVARPVNRTRYTG